MRINKSNITSFAYLISYKFFLQVVYIGFVYKNFQYMGFENNFNILKYIFSFVLLFLAYVILPKDKAKPSFFFLQLHLLIMLTPMLVVYYYMDKSTIFIVACFIVFMLQCIFVKYIPEMAIITIRSSKKVLYFILIGMSFFVYLSMIKAN